MKIERIRALMEQLGLSQAMLAKQIGVTQPAIQQILNGNTQRSRALPELARVLGVSVPYLLGDTGDPKGASVNAIMSPEDMAIELGVTRIREVPIEYGMGGGTFFEDYVEERWKIFDSEWLQAITPSPAQSLFVARGVGDSMMPTLLDDDVLLVDRAQRTIAQQDRIWALAYGEVGMVKRVRRLPRGRCLIMSDSPHVSDFEVTDEDLLIIGRVIWIGRKS